MNFVNSMAFTAITFVAFTALVALISWWKTRGDNLDTQDGYYLGGRSLTGPVIAGSLLMTNLSRTARWQQRSGSSRRHVHHGLGGNLCNRSGNPRIRPDAEVPEDRSDHRSAVL